MANTFTKLVALGTAVASIGAITFEFTPYSSQNSLIKKGVDSLKAIVQGKDEALAKLQAEYDEVMANLNDANASLETARQQLEAIYHKITNEAWDEANGDILNFDFNTLIKDGNQFENNVNGDAIAEILGLPAGSTTEQIIVAIQNLQNQIADLSTQVTNLQAQVAELQAEIATYKEEESALVLDLQQQIAELKARAENEANAIIEQANTEEQEQLDYINNTLTELGAEQVTEQVPEEDNGEGEEQEPVEPEQQAQPIIFNKMKGEDGYYAPLTVTALNSLGIEAVTDNPQITAEWKATGPDAFSVTIKDSAVKEALQEHPLYNKNNKGFFINEDTGELKALPDAYTFFVAIK